MPQGSKSRIAITRWRVHCALVTSTAVVPTGAGRLHVRAGPEQVEDVATRNAERSAGSGRQLVNHFSSIPALRSNWIMMKYNTTITRADVIRLSVKLHSRLSR